MDDELLVSLEMGSFTLFERDQMIPITVGGRIKLQIDFLALLAVGAHLIRRRLVFFPPTPRRYRLLVMRREAMLAALVDDDFRRIGDAAGLLGCFLDVLDLFDDALGLLCDAFAEVLDLLELVLVGVYLRG